MLFIFRIFTRSLEILSFIEPALLIRTRETMKYLFRQEKAKENIPTSSLSNLCVFVKNEPKLKKAVEDLEEQERLRINYVKQATKKILKEAQVSLEKREKEREKKRKIRNAKIEAAKLERNLKGDGTFPQVTMSALCLCLLLILLSTGQHEDRSEDLGRSAEAVQQSG